MEKVVLSSAVAAFQATLSETYWQEHGITDKECADGLIAMFGEMDVEVENDCIFDGSELVSAEELSRRRAYRAEAAERNKGNPLPAAMMEVLTQTGFLEREFEDRLHVR